MRLIDVERYEKDVAAGVGNVVGFEGLFGKSVLVTGASGLICSSVVDLLEYANNNLAAGIKIYLAVRNAASAVNRFGESENIIYLPYDAEKDITFSQNVDYIIHGAGNAHPDMMSKQPVETMTANIFGIKRLLEYARAHETKRVLYISSSEVYGIKQTDKPYKEDEYGYVDLLNPRSCYPIAKRASETMCVSFTAEYGVDSVIVRPGHIYGPTARPNDSRVSSMFAYMAAEGRDPVMKSGGTQVRSYCYCIDCASAILTVLLHGQKCEAYNISNPDSIISIRDMAQFLAAAGGVRLRMDIPAQTEKSAFNPMDNSSLDSEKLMSLGWRGAFGAEEGLTNTVNIIKNVLKEGMDA